MEKMDKLVTFISDVNTSDGWYGSSIEPLMDMTNIPELSSDETEELLREGHYSKDDEESGETTNYRLIPANSEINLGNLTVDDLIKTFCIKTEFPAKVKRFEFNHEVIFTEEMGMSLFDVARWLETNYDNDYTVHHFNIETV